MATIDLYFNELKKELNKEYSLEEFEELLFNYGLEIDSYNKDTDEIKIEVTAERVDLLSKEGLLRALKIYLGMSKPLNYSFKKSGFSLNIDDSVKDYRPFSVCAIVRNLKLDEDKLKQIINIQEKLHLTLGRKRTIAAIGIYPLEKINFPITFLAKNPNEINFIPLGQTIALNGKEILTQTETGKDYAVLLENKDKFPIFVDNSGEILSMPPIINSERTGRITEQTKDVFIECSGFDQNRLNQILNILVCVFVDFGGEVQTVEINYGKSYNLKSINTPIFEEEKRLVSLSHINSLIGINIDIDLATTLLEKMGYKCKKFGKDKIEVAIPIYRSDVLHEVDIIDDVARAYGFNNIEFKLPKVFTVGSVLKETKKQETIIDLMTQLGFIEVTPLSLSSKKESFTNLNLEYNDKKAIELGYSKDKQVDIVSPTHLPKLLKVLTYNQHRFFPQNIFVCDQAVLPSEKEETRTIQKLQLAALTANSKVSYSELVAVLFKLCNVLGFSVELQACKKPFYIEGRCAEIIVNNEIIGHIGEIAPSVLLNFEYTMPVVAFEMNVTKF